MSRISQIVVMLVAVFASASAFVSQSGAIRSMVKASSLSMKMDIPKIIASIAPMAVAAPAFASVDVRKNLLQHQRTDAQLKANLYLSYIHIHIHTCTNIRLFPPCHYLLKLHLLHILQSYSAPSSQLPF